MDLQEVGWGVMDWTALAQDMDSWRPLVKSAMNIRHKMRKICCLLYSQEGSMKLIR